MTLNHFVGYFDTGTTPSTNTNFGPFIVGTIFKLLRARVRFQHTIASQTITSPFAFQNLLVYGLQHGTRGYTPVSATGAASDPAWVDVGHSVGTLGPVEIDPSTNTAAYSAIAGEEINYEGQLPINSADEDFYFSYANQLGGSASWIVSGSLDLWWTSP